MNNLNKLSDSQCKVCPFCDTEFSEDTIRKHIGTAHLGLIYDECSKETVITNSKLSEESFEQSWKNKPRMNENSEGNLSAQVEIEFVDIKKVSDPFNDLEEESEETRIHDALLDDTVEQLKIDPEKSTFIANLDGLFECSQCDKKYQNWTSVARHQRIVHEPGKFPCKRCGKTFEEENNLRSHLEGTKHGSKHKHTRKYYCDHCERSFSSKQYAKIHMKNVHEGRKSQATCNVLNKTRFTNNLECDTCKKSFNRKDALKRHFEMVHLKIKNFLCNECGKSYSEKAKLLAHTLSAHQKVRFDCTKCEKSYSSKIHLRTHFKVMHEEGVDANLKKCSKCPYSSVRKSNLKRHLSDVHKIEMW